MGTIHPIATPARTMSIPSIRLFHVAAYAWLALYMVALLLLGNAAWTNAPVDLFTSHSRLALFVQRRIDLFTDGYGVHLCVATLLIAIALVRRHRWWLALLAWFLFRLLTHRTWLASNGGIQLMENMLFWSSFLVLPQRADQVSLTAFWIARLQLLLVYAVAAAHKFTGTSWLDGTAMLRVAHDPLFHLGFLAYSPMLCAALTWGTLAFMTLFPVAVWWKLSRRVFLLVGALFHLCTAVFMDIPQMGFAFIACYALWLDEHEARRIQEWFTGSLRLMRILSPGTS